MNSRPITVDRRTFLAGAGALGIVLASGCGGKDEAGARILGAAFANGLSSEAVLVPGIEQRAPLVLFDVASGRPMRDNPPASIDVELWVTGGKMLTKSKLTVHDDEISTPYYPLMMTLPEAGDYEIRAKFSDEPVGFRASARDKVPLVQVGDKLRPVDTPTTTNALGVTPICTRTPQCPLHDTSLAKVLETKGPTALLISTPGFCQTAVCGPVLELLMSERANFTNMRMVHAEVYIDPQEFATGKPNPRTTDAVKTYGLSYEPSLIVANADGIVVSRLDFTWDRAELRAALQRA